MLAARPVDLTVTPTVIAQCVHNVKMLLRDLPPGSFQQMLGPYGGTFGPQGERNDGILFTKETALMMHQALIGEGIRALRICSASNRTTMWCLVFAHDEEGFRAARRMAQRSTPAGVHLAFFPHC